MPGLRRMRQYAIALSCSMTMAAWLPISVQAADVRGAWTFDPQVLMARSDAVIARAPDASLDALFQAVLAAAHRPDELQAMCALFDPRAPRDLGAINRAAQQFGAPSRRRFERATDLLLAAADTSAPQPYDPALAQRALRQSAIASAMLHDGFVAAINGQGSDPVSQRARCAALRQLLDTVSLRPRAERAMITRLLMREGMARVER